MHGDKPGPPGPDHRDGPPDAPNRPMARDAYFRRIRQAFSILSRRVEHTGPALPLRKTRPHGPTRPRIKNVPLHSVKQPAGDPGKAPTHGRRAQRAHPPNCGSSSCLDVCFATPVRHAPQPGRPARRAPWPEPCEPKSRTRRFCLKRQPDLFVSCRRRSPGTSGARSVRGTRTVPDRRAVYPDTNLFGGAGRDRTPAGRQRPCKTKIRGEIPRREPTAAILVEPDGIEPPQDAKGGLQNKDPSVRSRVPPASPLTAPRTNFLWWSRTGSNPRRTPKAACKTKIRR